MPNPVPAQNVAHPSEVDRLVLCSRYSECLEICLAKKWPGFSCSECWDFELECPDDVDYWSEQGKNSRWLLFRAGYLPNWALDLLESLSEAEDFSGGFRRVKPKANPRRFELH